MCEVLFLFQFVFKLQPRKYCTCYKNHITDDFVSFASYSPDIYDSGISSVPEILKTLVAETWLILFPKLSNFFY